MLLGRLWDAFGTPLGHLWDAFGTPLGNKSLDHSILKYHLALQIVSYNQKWSVLANHLSSALYKWLKWDNLIGSTRENPSSKWCTYLSNMQFKVADIF